MKEKSKEIISRALTNASQSIVDDAIKDNVEFSSSSGLRSKILRISTGHCCKWCDDIAGEYYADEAPEDIYRRHDNCNCQVIYRNEKGYQNAHTKTWYKKYDSDTIKERKLINIDSFDFPNREIKTELKDPEDRFYIHPNKIVNFLLKPGAKHSQEFFDAGYTLDDYEKLFNDIVKAFDINKSKKLDGYKDRISIELFLGEKEKKFISIWKIDKNGKPRLLTCRRGK